MASWPVTATHGGGAVGAADAGPVGGHAARQAGTVSGDDTRHGAGRHLGARVIYLQPGSQVDGAPLGQKVLV